MNDGVVYFVSSNYSLSSETSLHCVIIKHKSPNGMEISVKHFLSLYLSNILNAFIVPPLETVVWWILPSQEFLDKADMYPWCFSLWRATRNIWGVLRNFSDTFSHWTWHEHASLYYFPWLIPCHKEIKLSGPTHLGEPQPLDSWRDSGENINGSQHLWKVLLRQWY